MLASADRRVPGRMKERKRTEKEEKSSVCVATFILDEFLPYREGSFEFELSVKHRVEQHSAQVPFQDFAKLVKQKNAVSSNISN